MLGREAEAQRSLEAAPPTTVPPLGPLVQGWGPPEGKTPGCGGGSGTGKPGLTVRGLSAALGLTWFGGSAGVCHLRWRG